MALRDPDGRRLQRLQLVKGWIDSDGQANVKVIDIAGDDSSGTDATSDKVDVDSPGFDKLCTVFIDSEFEAGLSTYYYLRVLEIPAPRWSWAQCMSLAESERPDECVNQAPKSIQERAWSSPIWYTPSSVH